jgi:hypothetical protein
VQSSTQTVCVKWNIILPIHQKIIHSPEEDAPFKQVAAADDHHCAIGTGAKLERFIAVLLPEIGWPALSHEQRTKTPYRTFFIASDKSRKFA